MKTISIFALFVSSLLQAQTASLRGTVTDPSGALVPGALVQLRGPGQEQRATSDDKGQYSFPTLQPGKYTIRVIAKGFTVGQKQAYDISSPQTLDMQLTIEAESQVVNVEEAAGQVTTDPGSNGDALVLHAKELEALSDDPDELAQQLQAMAGPAAGPNGGQIYIDGFTGGNLPPKSSIREIRINSNPYAPEYDRPGFGRIEILTRPGTDSIRGQVFFQFNNQDFNSRSALYLQPSLPPYKQIFEGFNISGPIKKNKASFSLDFDRRDITENAFIIATTLDSNFNPVSINQGVVTPQTRMTITPRLDYTINDKNTLVVRYQNTRIGQDDNGVGSYSLVSQAYDTTNQENTIQMTETAVLSAKAINETRFQYQHISSTNTAAETTPQINVVGAFVTGGSPQGNSGSTQNNYELTNNTTYIMGTHSFKWGARIRQSGLTATSRTNFNGGYTFLGGAGPQLDANNQPIAGTTVALTALEVYQRTLMAQTAGLNDAQVRALGGGATQFQQGAGTPTISVNQFDIGLYLNDDWRLRPNVTLSLGLRYENQTNISDYGNFAPRAAVAWGLDAHGNTPAKTVLRAGAGIFYDRIPLNSTLNAELYDGVTQQSYFILNPVNPSFIGSSVTLPPLSSLTSSPQQLQLLYAGIVAPRSYQANVSVDRTINKYARISAQYMTNRGVHLTRSLNINAPVDGVYPFGDPSLRQLTEAVGFSKTNQFIVSPNVNYKKFFLFGFYSYAHGKDDNEGAPASVYDLKAEWGPSSFADVRHRAVIGTNIPMPWQISLSPFLIMNSGSPYNITTGIDLNGDGVAAERPSLATGVAAASCTGTGFKYETGYGCFNLNPAPGTAIERNYGRGPSSETLMLRIARTWAFGEKAGANPQQPGGMGGPGGGPPMGGGGPPRGGGGPPPGGGGGGGGPMMMGGGGAAGKKYSLTLSVQASNALNHTNFGAPVGNLSSPYFGESVSLASGFGPPGGGSGGSPTYNRKITLQMRFTF
jgi:Carboxypeptidase regulatory-like domain